MFLCIGDEIILNLNYTKKTMVSLLLGSEIAHQGDISIVYIFPMQNVLF